jgi:hypothetical protein
MPRFLSICSLAFVVALMASAASADEPGPRVAGAHWKQVRGYAPAPLYGPDCWEAWFAVVLHCVPRVYAHIDPAATKVIPRKPLPPYMAIFRW